MKISSPSIRDRPRWHRLRWPLWEQWRQQLAQVLASPPASTAYRRWRSRFVRDRIRLAIWVGLVLLAVLIVLNFSLVVPSLMQTEVETLGISIEQYRLYPLSFTLTELGLLLNWWLLRPARAERWLKWHFGAYSALIILLPQVLHMFWQLTSLDLGGWILFFMLQAVLIPVHWRWHLLSQLSLLSLLAISMFGFQFPSPGVPAEMQVPVFIFHLSVLVCVFVVSDLGIVLYEQLLRREFELRQQLELFLHAVSHDLRNPVTGTLMLLNNLPAQADKVWLEQTMVQQMIAGQERQLKLINSLLEAHAQDVAGVVLTPQSVALEELVTAIAQEMHSQLQAAQTDLQITMPANLPPVAADPLQLRRVYDNMIANALQYNHPGLCLTLGAGLRGRYLYCTVSDNGQGIAPTMPNAISPTQSVFERYHRGLNPREPLHLGLGLYICQQIIEAHGGVIGVASQPKQGTTFWFTLPLAAHQSYRDV